MANEDDIMKCDRCGKNFSLGEIRFQLAIYTLCESCLIEFNKFIEGAKVYNYNWSKAYFTVIYNDEM